MPQFTVDEDLAALVERLAKPKPFENLSFNTALRRVLNSHVDQSTISDYKLDRLLAESMALAAKHPRKAPSPNPSAWVASIPELRNKAGLASWKAICSHLDIDTAGDSARRKLSNWVRQNKPKWPSVPGISESDA
ncbi:MAG: hypothetical protein V4505_07640 [Pseudomonadota bacterium]